MPMPKSDDEIRRGWGPLERSFEKWYKDNDKAIGATRRLGAKLGAFETLWSQSYPKEHAEAFDKWCDEWLGRHFERMTCRVHPREFIQTVKDTNFTDINSFSNLFWQMDVYNLPFIALGRSNFGNVPTYYIFKPTGRALQPDVETNGPGITSDHILALNLPDMRPRSVSEANDPSNNPFSSESGGSSVPSVFPAPLKPSQPRVATVGNPTEKARGEIDPNHFVFAQLGALHVFGGRYDENKADDLSAINEGPWWSNGFVVIVRLSEKGVPGAVYVLYNAYKGTEPADDDEEDEEDEDFDGHPVHESYKDEEDDDIEHSPEAAGHIPGYLHPRSTEGFRFAKIADSVEELGDHKRRFSFIPITQEDTQIVRARLLQSRVNYEVKDGKRVWDWYIAPETGEWKEPIKSKGQPGLLQTTTSASK
ncbi:hypothetical protein ACHAPA_005131 [Fusarium lateritium]